MMALHRADAIDSLFLTFSSGLGCGVWSFCAWHTQAQFFSSSPQGIAGPGGDVRGNSGSVLAEGLRLAGGQWARLFDVPSKQSFGWNEFRGQAEARLRTVELKRRSKPGAAIPSSRPVTLLVFLAASAGAGIVAADFGVGAYRGRYRNRLVASVQREFGLRL